MKYFMEWTVSIVMVAAACGFLESAAPSGGMKKFLSFIFSVIFLSVLLSPVEFLAG